MIETRSVSLQLIELCQQELAEGRWLEGERFPSERELAKAHGISRATANKVVAKLASEGWLEIRRGQGTFVARRTTLRNSLRQLESFTDFARGAGLVSHTEVIHFERVESSGHFPVSMVGSNGLGDYFYFRRIRFLNRVPVILEERWVPVWRYPGLSSADVAESFFRLSKDRYGIEANREDTRIRAVLPPTDVGAEWDAPCLLVEGHAFDDVSEVIWFQRLYYHGEHFALHHLDVATSAYPELSLQLENIT